MGDAISKTSDPAALAGRLADERPADIAEALNRNASGFAAKVLLALPEPLAVEVQQTALLDPSVEGRLRHSDLLGEFADRPFVWPALDARRAPAIFDGFCT